MLRRARPDEAVTAFDEALRLDPGNAVAKQNVSLLRSRGAGGLVRKSA